MPDGAQSRLLDCLPARKEMLASPSSFNSSDMKESLAAKRLSVGVRKILVASPRQTRVEQGAFDPVQKTPESLVPSATACVEGDTRTRLRRHEWHTGDTKLFLFNCLICSVYVFHHSFSAGFHRKSFQERLRSCSLFIRAGTSHGNSTALLVLCSRSARSCLSVPQHVSVELLHQEQKVFSLSRGPVGRDSSPRSSQGKRFPEVLGLLPRSSPNFCRKLLGGKHESSRMCFKKTS